MRFEDLEGRSSVPIEAVRDRFRYEVVLAVLPVRGGRDGKRQTLLVATPGSVAVITSSRFPRETWMTQWAPWDIIDVRPASDDPAVQTITVGRRVFETVPQGETGRRALADFLAVLEDRRVALGGAGPS